ncbi:MAG: hypothetical protein PHD21_01055 [Flavobacteriales bacterium]|nr:hypothetical protein [Flavobacteriales bacterium]
MSDEFIHVEFSMLENVDEKKYPQYAKMSESERKSLPATNFWRLKNNMDVIPVPENDLYYKNYFRSLEQVSYVNSKRK